MGSTSPPMSDIVHIAILVTSYGEHTHIANRKALDIFAPSRVSRVGMDQLNGISTFVIFPSGSKEGWPEADRDLVQRKTFITWLESQEDGDGSSPFSWVEVRYGDPIGRAPMAKRWG